MIFLCREKGEIVFWANDYHRAMKWQRRGYSFLKREVVHVPMLTEADAEERETR